MQIASVDYNDNLYICISGHGSKDTPYRFGYCQNESTVFASQFSLAQYTDHSINCRYIVDACYSGHFASERSYTYKDSFGRQQTRYWKTVFAIMRKHTYAKMSFSGNLNDYTDLSEWDEVTEDENGTKS